MAATATMHQDSRSTPAHYLPIVGWLRTYDRSWLRLELIAGRPPEAGLFTTFAGLLGYVAFGISRRLVVSPTSSTAAISASLVAGLAVMTAVIFIVLGLFGAGFVSQFIATVVQTGLMFGLGFDDHQLAPPSAPSLAAATDAGEGQ